MIINFGHQLDKLTLELVRGATRGRVSVRAFLRELTMRARPNVMIAFQGLLPPQRHTLYSSFVFSMVHRICS